MSNASVGDRGRRRGRDLAWALSSGALVVLFFLILLWRNPLLFWNDDYQLSILPVFADVARAWSEGHLPLLSPYSWVCSNLAGEFQYGTFSIFVNAVVVLIWKLPLNFAEQAAALSISHLAALAMGGYLLGRERKLGPPLALMVALVSALNGWIVCWGATDWFGALGAFAWLPWAWWGLERALDSRRGPYRFLWPAPFVYLLITGGFPYTVVMLALLAAWLAIRSIVQKRSIASVWPLVFGMLLGVGLAAPAWLALFDYVSGSARQAQDPTSHFQWIVPLAALPGFILPAWTVPWADFSTRLIPHGATELACGFVPPVVLLFACAVRARAVVRRLKWELTLLAVLLLLSILPTTGMFRWSFRWLPFLEIVLTLCAAEAVQLLADRREGWWNAGTFAVLLLLALGGVMWLAKTAGLNGWPLFAVMLTLALCWACAQMSFTSVRAKMWLPPIVTATAFLLTYFYVPTNGGVPKYNLDPALAQPAPLDPARLYLSVYPAPELNYLLEKQPTPFGTVIRPGSTSMWGGVRLVNGYSPIRPAGVAREFDFAIHGEIAPWAGDYFPGRRGEPDDLLARLGVDGIILARESEIVPKPEAEWALVHSSQEGRVYHRRGEPLPRIQSLVADESRAGEVFARAVVERIADTRNQVEADVTVPTGEHPSLLTFSRPFFRGYEATFSGRVLPVSSWRGLTPAVEVPAGSSGHLILRYRPWWLMTGGTVAIFCGVICLAGLALGLRASR